MKAYLRVDAVNLNYFVYDTHDISTIRGGSFLLLHAIKGLSIKFKGRLNLITHAASQGLFWFDAPEDALEGTSQRYYREVLTYLNDMTGGHATFLVATQPDIPNDFNLVIEKLEAQIHRQQWRIPTVAIPAVGDDATGECYLDGWRPGKVKFGVDPTNPDTFISEATSYRRDRGVRLKQDLFFEILHNLEYLGQISSKDLGELSLDPTKGILSGKIAFIHMDGNGFGSIRRCHIHSMKDRQDFDDTIQDFRNSFLENLLEWANAAPDFQTRNAQKELALRLEVLLWGGDEATLVVPAWLGWQVMNLFYATSKNLSFHDQPLSHRAVMIFCHHNAPILLIRELAENLLQRTKRDIQTCVEAESHAHVSDHIYGDSLHYLVLESFDMLQGDLDGFLKSYYRGAQYQNLLISAQEMDGVFQNLRTIQSLVARSKAINAIKAIQRQDGSAMEAISKLKAKTDSEYDQERLKSAISSLIERDVSRWYLITDLWDYLPE